MTTEEKKRTYKQTLSLVKKMQKKLSTPLETRREWLDEKLEELFNLAGFAIVAYLKKEITKEERDMLLSYWNKKGLRFMHIALASALAKGEKIGAEKERARLSGWLMHDDNCKGLYFDPKKTSKCDCGLADALKG